MSRAKQTDLFGRSIRVGDVISYPVRKGSAMWFNDGKVTDVHSEGLQVINPASGRKTQIQNTEMAVLAPREYRADINRRLAA